MPFRGLNEAGEELPCRQRRLEPWRRQVREHCTVETDKVCSGISSSSSPVIDFVRQEEQRSLSPLAKEIDAYFDDVIISPTLQDGGRRTEEEVEDDFLDVFQSMLEFSLRAFDQMSLDEDSIDATTTVTEADVEIKDEQPVVDDREDEEEEEASVDQAFVDQAMDSAVDQAVAPASLFESSAFSSSGEEITPAATTMSMPEQAAEDTLDAMVASLIRAISITPEVEEAQQQQQRELDNSLNFFASRFFQVGKDLLEDTQTRRRLTEGESTVADPHLKVKERLGRRLTEYRTDLFAHPDGTITILRSGSSSFSSFDETLGGAVPTLARPLFSRGAPPAPLGMNSRNLDECLLSRYDNGDLENENCRDAVGQLLLAVDHRAVPVDIRRQEQQMQSHATQTVMLDLSKGSQQVVQCHKMFVIASLIISLLAALYVVAAYEEVEDEEGDEFDYEKLPDDDDAQEVPAKNAGERVFVGIPVQVV